MSSDLKTQFVNYMSLQRFSHHTKRSYLTGVKLLAKHYMQSPDTLSNDQIQDYIRYLLEERKLSWGHLQRLFVRYCLLLQTHL